MRLLGSLSILAFLLLTAAASAQQRTPPYAQGAPFAQDGGDVATDPITPRGDNGPYPYRRLPDGTLSGPEPFSGNGN